MQRRSSRGVRGLIWPMVDMTVVALGLWLAVVIRVGWPPPAFNALSLRLALPWALLLLWVVYFAMGLYESSTCDHVTIVKKIVVANVIVALGLIVMAFWLRAFAFPRSVIVLGFLVNCVASGLLRLLVTYLRRTLGGERRVLIVGAASEVHTLITKIQALPFGSFRVVELVLPEVLISREPASLNGVDAVLVGGSTSPEHRRRILAMAQHASIDTYLIPDLYDIMVLGSEAEQFQDIPVLHIRSLGLSSLDVIAKRVLDLVVAVPMLLVSAPLIAIAGLVLCMTSPGPLFYSQERVGRYGKRFHLWKIRSMVVNAERSGPQLATSNDPRVTPVGRVLRDYRLDELPQLWNVITGEMSLVGPRPERPFYVEQFASADSEYNLRHVVAPGITGLAQVLGNYSTDVADKLRYDLHYIRNYSMLLDLRILLMTVQTVLNPNQARGTVAQPQAKPTSLRGA